MEERDPKKRLKMFSVNVEIKGRINILKSLLMVKGQIISHVEI